MNHHADKLVYGEPATEAAAGALGEMIKEFHTCAQCGSSAMRSATEGSQQL
jgi:hypothetical protein